MLELDQALEQLLATTTIFYQRVLLAYTHPVNAFTQVIHVFEVLHP